MRFQDRVVLITGAARGQGRAHALAFAREGAHVVLCDTPRHYASVPYVLGTAEELAQVAHEVEALGRSVIAQQVDVTDLPAMEQFIEQAHERLGPIDIAIANAGLYSFAPTWELSEQQWDDTCAVVLKGTWITCKIVIPQMLARQRGSILCVGSTGSMKGLPGLGHYVAAKHGVLGLVKTLAIELAPYQINVNAICPTTVDTGIVNNQAFFAYFAGGPGPQATREYVIARMKELNLLPERHQPCGLMAGFTRGSAYHWLYASYRCWFLDTMICKRQMSSGKRPSLPTSLWYP
jgi:(+)-trans-carveol dehydrogenase